MTETPRVVLTLLVFTAALGGVLLRPRGWNEAWWTVGGAIVLLGTGLVSPGAAWAVTWAGKDVLLFLLALLLLSALLEKSGFFEWAAIRAAQAAMGDARRLFRNVFLLGTVITAALSLDTTAVILTPLTLAFVTRLKVPARPYVFACAFVANTASLLLPVSNLTNLLFMEAFHLPFSGFVARMVLPQIAALVVSYACFRFLFRDQLPKHFDPAVLPEPLSVVPHRRYFEGAVVILVLVLAGYFIAPFAHLPLYAVGFAGCVLMVFWGQHTKQVEAGVLREIAWSLFPFVIGLFVLVRGVENLGLVGSAVHWLRNSKGDHLPAILATAGGAGLASNIVNNIPAALLAQGVLKAAHAGPPMVYSVLLGTNIGPNLTLFGSLATMLVLTTARKKGEEIRGLDFFRVGMIVTPLTLLAAAVTLWLTFLIEN